MFGPSDIRIKENIVFDGAWKGHNVYTYNFKGRDYRSRGVIAQEVALTRPDAVMEIDGIKHVNYGAL
jgi:methionine synthase I (cobalamin-dependent)